MWAHHSSTAACGSYTGYSGLHVSQPALVSVFLPVRKRIQYKLASLAFRALSGLAPDYLASDCQLVADSGRRSLRSAERRVCSVPRQNSTFGDRSFAAAGPRAWNELPFSLRDTRLSLTTLTLIFHSVWGHGAFVTFTISLRRIYMYLLTYLLTVCQAFGFL